MIARLVLRLPNRARQALLRPLESGSWRRRAYAAPSPPHIKRAVLLRACTHPATWVETGTYLGDTTAALARSGALHVYTIEPDRKLAARARARFSQMPTVTVVEGASEDVLPELLPTLAGPVAFWLDGHYSGGVTHQGTTDTPIRQELQAIADHLGALRPVTVVVDDVRCFDPTIAAYAGYPSRDDLIDWARGNGLAWHVEHDMFVARGS
ncbi:MAG: hypothetical protein ACKVUT_02690 [Gaiella sp.]